MILKELIDWLEQQPQNAVVQHGFGRPMSYRGYYDELAFDPVEETTFGNMLRNAKSALGATFTGYKGGEYMMDEYTECWVCRYGTSNGDQIGPTMLKLWKAIATKEA